MPVSRTSTVSAQRPAAAVAGQPMPADVELDLAVLGELDRVGQQVEDDLAEPALVADDRPRQALVDRVDELEVLGRGGRCEHVEGALDARASANGLVVELDLAGLDLREVEDVVDDRQQRVAGRPDRLGVVALLLVERACRAAARSSR